MKHQISGKRAHNSVDSHATRPSRELSGELCHNFEGEGGPSTLRPKQGGQHLLRALALFSRVDPFGGKQGRGVDIFVHSEASCVWETMLSFSLPLPLKEMGTSVEVKGSVGQEKRMPRMFSWKTCVQFLVENVARCSYVLWCSPSLCCARSCRSDYTEKHGSFLT